MQGKLAYGLWSEKNIEKAGEYEKYNKKKTV